MSYSRFMRISSPLTYSLNFSIMTFKPTIISFLISCLCLMASFSSQAQSNEMTMHSFAGTEKFDTYSEWKPFSYKSRIILEARTAVLSTSKEGCNFGIELKNTQEVKIKGTLLVFYEFDGNTALPETIKYSIKPGETAILTHLVKNCGTDQKDNRYGSCLDVCRPAYNVLVD